MTKTHYYFGELQKTIVKEGQGDCSDANIRHQDTSYNTPEDEEMRATWHCLGANATLQYKFF